MEVIEKVKALEGLTIVRALELDDVAYLGLVFSTGDYAVVDSGSLLAPVDNYLKRDLGVITLEEYEEGQREIAKNYKVACDRVDKSEYERLKLKFEGIRLD